MKLAKEKNLIDFKVEIAESKMRYAIEAMEYRRRMLEEKSKAEKLRKERKSC